MTLPSSVRADPLLGRKAALIVLNHARSQAHFLGLSVNVPYGSDDSARCLEGRCPVLGEHEVPHPDGSCGFHATTEDPLQWFMPEVALLHVEFFGRVIRHERGVRASHQRVLGAAFVLVDLLIDGPIGLLAGRLGTLLAGHRRAVRRLHIATGSIFIGLSARLALTR
jgi:hypothetical protein